MFPFFRPQNTRRAAEPHERMPADIYGDPLMIPARPAADLRAAAAMQILGEALAGQHLLEPDDRNDELITLARQLCRVLEPPRLRPYGVAAFEDGTP